MQVFLEKIFKFVFQSNDFRGRIWLLSCLQNITRRSLFIKSVYGFDIRANFLDTTWKLACKGYPDSRVADEITKIEPGHCFIDVGANLGVFSLLAAENLEANGLVVAFEPNPLVFEDLVMNFNRNKPACHYQLLNMGIAEDTSIVGFESPDFHSGKGKISFDTGAASRTLVTSPTKMVFLSEAIGERQITLKIDVEGAEYLVAKSILESGLLPKIQKVIVEIDQSYLHSFGTTRDELYGFFETKGFVPTYNEDKKHFDEVFIHRSQFNSS